MICGHRVQTKGVKRIKEIADLLTYLFEVGLVQFCIYLFIYFVCFNSFTHISVCKVHSTLKHTPQYGGHPALISPPTESQENSVFKLP